METTPAAVPVLRPMRRSTTSFSEVSSDVTAPTMGKLGAAMFKTQQAPDATSGAPAPRVGGMAALLKKKSLRNSVTAMISMRRMSKGGKGPSSAASTQPRVLNMENTYKMVPDDKSAFSASHVTKIAESVLAGALNGVKYNAEFSKELAGDLSTMIKDRVKNMGFQRYKLVCQIIIGERRDQGLQVATRCLWNTDTDDWACAKFSNDSLYAVAMIHGAYFE